MVHIYYHIYSIEGVDSIIDEQIKLIETYFNFPYILNVGISIADDNSPTDSIIKRFYDYHKPNYRLRDVRSKGHEFVTLDLIEKDRDKFNDSDYIFYFHTKGASKQGIIGYDNIVSWRKIMNYFNIEKVNNVFQIFEKTTFNTYGILYGEIGKMKLYSGNFWWMKSEYAKTIDISKTKKNRWNAEINFISNGLNWKPYSPYNREDENHYDINFKREEYAKTTN